jgi:hypothetical protein
MFKLISTRRSAVQTPQHSRITTLVAHRDTATVLWCGTASEYRKETSPTSDCFSTNKVYSMKSSDSPSKQLDAGHLENEHNASGRAWVEWSHLPGTGGHNANLRGRVGSCNQELALEVWGLWAPGTGKLEQKLVEISAVKHPSTTIRIPFKVISGPFWPAESNRNLHLFIALLVVARLARTSPKSQSLRAKNSAHTSSSPRAAPTNYNQNSVEGWF